MDMERVHPQLQETAMKPRRVNVDSRVMRAFGSR
jgi:hypothetical protein